MEGASLDDGLKDGDDGAVVLGGAMTSCSPCSPTLLARLLETEGICWFSLFSGSGQLGMRGACGRAMARGANCLLAVRSG